MRHKQLVSGSLIYAIWFVKRRSNEGYRIQSIQTVIAMNPK